MDCRAILEEQARLRPGKPAFITKDATVTFLQLKDLVLKLAAVLSRHALKGERVAIYLPNSLEYVYSYLAVWCLGMVAVPLDFMLTEEEVVSCVSHSEATLLIGKPKLNVSLAAVKERCPGLKAVISRDEGTHGCPSLHEALQAETCEVPAPAVLDTDYAIIFYTSGTTGKPKGVLVNYRQLEASPKAMKYFVNNDLTDSDIGLCALPFSHLGGLIYLQANLLFGATILLMERFLPLEFLRSVANHKVNWFWLVPSMYYALLQLKEFEHFDLSTLRWVVVFGAPSSSDAIRKFHQHCPKATLFHGWGMTETNAPTTVIPAGSPKIESVGKPPPWIQVKVFSDTALELPQGEIGEVVVRGWVVTDGYYRDAQATTHAMRAGWFHTGDLGRFDEEGYLYIVGRKKEMIKVGGEIVFEPEIEAAIHKHQDVVEVAAIGVPDPLRGEVPKAYIVLKGGSGLSEEEMRYFLRQHLAHFKIPHHIEFVPQLPKNRVGKIDKEKLRTSVS
ncbi:MAG: class I adenylate-forming enzyme family protein [Candidatus Omnitrophica bacterium]|nr:class I adenylate-forming enzyme family protein [Candidatus Omnitrophota bacterium]